MRIPGIFAPQEFHVGRPDPGILRQEDRSGLEPHWAPRPSPLRIWKINHSFLKTNRQWHPPYVKLTIETLDDAQNRLLCYKDSSYYWPDAEWLFRTVGWPRFKDWSSLISRITSIIASIKWSMLQLHVFEVFLILSCLTSIQWCLVSSTFIAVPSVAPVCTL